LILGSTCWISWVAVERFAFRPLRRKDDPLLTVVSSLGVSVVIVNLIISSWRRKYISSEYLRLASCYQLWHSGKTSSSQCSGSHFLCICGDSAIPRISLIRKYGKTMQAVAEDPTTASLLGINADPYCPDLLSSSFLAGLAGTLVGSK